MVATLASCFFAFAAGLAVFAIAITSRSHSGAWSKLAEEGRRLIEREARSRSVETAEDERYPATVDARPVFEPVAAIVYKRRFTGRSAPALLQCPGQRGLRAAA